MTRVGSQYQPPTGECPRIRSGRRLPDVLEHPFALPLLRDRGGVLEGLAPQVEDLGNERVMLVVDAHVRFEVLARAAVQPGMPFRHD